MSLKDFSTKDLALELQTRRDLMDAGGLMLYEVYRLVEKVQPMVCTDGVPVRRRSDGQIEAMVAYRTTRHTGPSSIGGRVWRRESIENCLRRQFGTDLGCAIRLLVPWYKPVTVAQWAPRDEGPLPAGFGPETGRHTVSLYFPVELIGEPTKLGSTAHGGQEVGSFHWYTADELPPHDDWGYRQRPQVETCMAAAEKLLP